MVGTDPVPDQQKAPVSILDDDDLFEDFEIETVLRDGFMPVQQAKDVWRKWCNRAGLDSRRHLLAMAVSCASGTSAETNLEERFLEMDNPKSCVARFLDYISDDDYLAGRSNKLRVWARSMEDFAAITRKVILRNPTLAAERAAEYETEPQFAGVCFDYAEVLNGESIHLTPTERRILKYGLRYKAGDGRPATYAGEGVGVPNSSPAARGVAGAVAPSGGRVTRGGSGPFA